MTGMEPSSPSHPDSSAVSRVILCIFFVRVEQRRAHAAGTGGDHGAPGGPAGGRARTVDTLTAEVPEDRPTSAPRLAAAIGGAVEMALGDVPDLAAEEPGRRPHPALGRLEAAYALGRGEARDGGGHGGLLACTGSVPGRPGGSSRPDGATRQVNADHRPFAQLVFKDIDQLSGASVAGHRRRADQRTCALSSYLEQLGRGLLEGEPLDRLEARTEPACSTGRLRPASPRSVLPAAHQRAALSAPRPKDARGVRWHVVPGAAGDTGVLLVPDVHLSRAALLGALRGRGAVVGPTRDWSDVQASYRRALWAIDLLPVPTGDALDTDSHLVELVLGADADALDDLRTHALVPLADLRPATADRLTETLREWLLHQGRREEVATVLQVHPQTVRYRMTQLRDIFGDRLTAAADGARAGVALGAGDQAASAERRRGSTSSPSRLIWSCALATRRRRGRGG